jgi:hypothetical protein
MLLRPRRFCSCVGCARPTGHDRCPNGRTHNFRDEARQQAEAVQLTEAFWGVLQKKTMRLTTFLVGGLEHEFYDFPYIGNNME